MYRVLRLFALRCGAPPHRSCTTLCAMMGRGPAVQQRAVAPAPARYFVILLLFRFSHSYCHLSYCCLWIIDPPCGLIPLDVTAIRIPRGGRHARAGGRGAAWSLRRVAPRKQHGRATTAALSGMLAHQRQGGRLAQGGRGRRSAVACLIPARHAAAAPAASSSPTRGGLRSAPRLTFASCWLRGGWVAAGCGAAAAPRSHARAGGTWGRAARRSS